MAASGVQTVRFPALEYTRDGCFQRAEYEFSGSPGTGWAIRRNGAAAGALGAGYTLVRSIACGVCSTDLARRHLPYPLPQVLGHEVVGREVATGRRVVCEINASHKARGVVRATAVSPNGGKGGVDCPFCSLGMDTQCPARVTLGIDRLPGGFGAYFLAPRVALYGLPDALPTELGCLVEPLAAALHAVEVTPPVDGARVAVLGPRRLGLLIIAALEYYRGTSRREYRVTAVVRHDRYVRHCRGLGADEVVDTSEYTKAMAAPCPPVLREQFDIVFDTTGNPEGFDVALAMVKPRGVLHVKSTCGRETSGLKELTHAVVDELAVLPYTTQDEVHRFALPEDELPAARVNNTIYLSEDLDVPIAPPREGIVHYRGSVEEAASLLSGAVSGDVQTPTAAATHTEEDAAMMNTTLNHAVFHRFDAAVVSSLEELDAVVRAGIVRPRGAVFLTQPVSSSRSSGAAASATRDAATAPHAEDTPLSHALRDRAISIYTSRCGSFPRAIDVLARRRDMWPQLTALITHRLPVARLAAAFEVAGHSIESIKVVVDVAEGESGAGEACGSVGREAA